MDLIMDRSIVVLGFAAYLLTIHYSEHRYCG
jgi:hypothetical protein